MLTSTDDSLALLIERHRQLQLADSAIGTVSNDTKLSRIELLLQKSQVYSQIIAENILAQAPVRENTVPDGACASANSSPPEKSPENTREPHLTPQSAKAVRRSRASGPAAKRRKRVTGAPQVDIAAMLTSRKKAAPVLEEAKASENASKGSTQPSLLSGGILKDYQLDGLEWLTTLFKNGLNGILADEMGLGKTIQCIAFLCFLVENGFHGPFFIVVPLSTLSNWKAEINRFAPNLKVILYQGTKAERAAITSTSLSTYNVVLTSYEISIRDFKTFNQVNWKYLIVDEGHRLKNNECLLIRALKSLNVTNRLLITGTPLQNNLNELWSLLNFILPDIFQDLDLFQQWFDFDELPEEGNDPNQSSLHAKKRLVSNMHAILKPFLLRRLKRDVITNLPPKKEYLISIPLTGVQRKLYHAALNRNLAASILKQYLAEYIENVHKSLFQTESDRKVLVEFWNELDMPLAKINLNRSKTRNYKELDSDDEFDTSPSSEVLKVSSKRASRLSRTESQYKLLNELHAKFSKEIKALSLQNPAMQLRNICNSPYLYYEPFEIDRENPNAHHESLFFDSFEKNSPKVQVLNQICLLILDSKSETNSSKILIFSQFTRMLDLLQDWFEHEGREVCRLDGSTSQSERDDEIANFNKSKNARLFLLSTRAGGLGINLTAADTVVLFDSDWNPQMDLQAIDRVHRIGQTKPVKVFRFVAQDSIEEILISKSMSKRFLEKLVIQLGEYKFNKLRGIPKNSDTFDLSAKDVLEFSKLVYKPTATSTGDCGSQSPNQSVLAEDVLTSFFRLSDAEMEELLDRSPECYSRVMDEHAFPNITSFETFNNFDQ